ncbi:MAG: hypothetical protein WCY57_07945, partial [Micavibrio sp.]
MNKRVTGLLRRWAREEEATAFTESVILLPVMLTLLMGCYDLGHGLMLNQKTVAASQIIGDLIARERSITAADLNDIVLAGQLALEPNDTEPFGYDIASIGFDENGRAEVLWRVTYNMAENADAITTSESLGGSGDGLIVVTASYEYKPYFLKLFSGEINMKEVAYLHGRRSATI